MPMWCGSKFEPFFFLATYAFWSLLFVLSIDAISWVMRSTFRKSFCCLSTNAPML
jgi:hypothetical protein